MNRRGRLLPVATFGLLLVASCGDLPTPTTTEPTVPPGVVAAVPFQNRLDVAQGIFQMKLYNGTDRTIDVTSVQLLWDGLTTPVGDRRNRVAAGDRIDFPVPLAPARCAGDGTLASMPPLSAARVRVALADGTTVDAPVVDAKGFAAKLYLQDCERQRIEATVRVEWVDLGETELDGRPITEGALRLTRLAGDDEVVLQQVGNTVLFTLDLPQGNRPVATVARGAAAVQVPVRILEGRCDVHARSEASQPFAFAAVIDLGDGEQRPLLIPPPEDQQPAIRARYEDACSILGGDGFVGQSAPSTSSRNSLVAAGASSPVQ